MGDLRRQTLLTLRDVLFDTCLLISTFQNQTALWQERRQELEALIDELEGSYGADDTEAAGKIS